MSVAILRKLYQPLAIAVALVFVYFTVLLKLGGDWWNDENYSHGLLIPFVIGYILWQERKGLSEAQIRPAAWWGAIGVGVSLLMLWAGVAGAELFVQRVSLVLMKPQGLGTSVGGVRLDAEDARRFRVQQPVGHCMIDGSTRGEVGVQ